MESAPVPKGKIQKEDYLGSYFLNLKCIICLNMIMNEMD